MLILNSIVGRARCVVIVLCDAIVAQYNYSVNDPNNYVSHFYLNVYIYANHDIVGR